MNSFIEPLNVWGAHFIDFAPPMLWQSTLLMALVFGFDFLLRRKIRPGVRYALWFVVFVKLLLPPTLALPTGAAWWLRSRPAIVPPPHTSTVRVSYGSAAETVAPPEVARTFIPPPGPKLSSAAWAMLASVLISAFLFAWSVFRWRQIVQCLRRTTSPPDTVSQLLAAAGHTAGLRGQIRLRLTSEAISPAVCGLFRPTVLLPQALIANLSPEQIRAVLLHELIHLRRHDVWVNCAQTLLQIFYWWHPLLWFANARVRRLREEAVDDAVMCALNEEAEIYAPTLLEVAKLAFHRPLSSLGLVGILESRNALRQRIERLLNFATPRRAGLSVMSIIGIAAFSALAVPMGEPPARPIQSGELSDSEPLIMFHAKVNPEIFIRNLKARASGTMHTPADDPRDVLISILESFGVDSTPPRSITLNPQAGEITAQNTSEALGILDEVVKELNLPGGEHILNPPHNLKQVLIEAQFYEIRPEDAGKLHLMWRSSHHDGNLTPWWELSPDNLTEAQQRLKELGIQPLSSPRIQTSHGIAASLFVGDGTNNIQLECLPFIRDGLVNLTALARTSGKYAPGGKAWPDVAGHTNCAIFSRISLHDGDGAGFVAGQAGTATKLLVLLKAKILEPAPPAKPPTAKSAEKPFLRTDLVRQKTFRKLNDIVFVKVSFPDIALGEVVSNLSEMTRRRDSDHEGIKFVLNPAPPPPTGSTNDDDLVFADLPSVHINLDPGLSDPRLVDVLEGIVKSADHPIKYSLMKDGRIEFSFRGAVEPELYTRTFKLDANTFVRGLETAGVFTNGLDSSKPSEIQRAVLNFFTRSGVDLQPPKSVFWNNRKGTLTVRATAKDLDLIEAPMDTLDIPPPQVSIKVWFVEVETNFAAKLGYNWYLGPPDGSHPYVSTNILTAGQFRTVLKALQESGEAKVLSEGQVITLSGRPVELKMTEAVTNVNHDVINRDAVFNAAPYVCADGETIEMTLTPTVYITIARGSPGYPVWPPLNVAGVPLMTLTRAGLPAGRGYGATATYGLSDGETIVLGNFSDSAPINMPDGHLKWIDFFESRNRRLLIFVTPALVDATGNRVHQDDLY